MGAPSFGSFGPAGPGFGSIQNAPATGVNPTAFPTAPPPAVGGGGMAPGGLGNMVGVNLQPAQQGPAPATPQPFRAPLPLPPPAAPAAPAPAPSTWAIPQGAIGAQRTPEAPGGGNFMAGANTAFANGDNSYLARMGYGPGGSITPGSQAAQFGRPQPLPPLAAPSPQGQQPSLFGLGGY